MCVCTVCVPSYKQASWNRVKVGEVINLKYTTLIKQNGKSHVLYSEVGFEQSEGLSLKWDTSTTDDENSNSTVDWLTHLINLP